MGADSQMSLNPNPARKDLTDRECTKIIGSLLGGLIQMAEVSTVKKAIRWWSDNFDDASDFLEEVKRKLP